jgi:hypothetical protein
MGKNSSQEISIADAIDIIEDRGYQAFYYLHDLEPKDDLEFWNAVETLKYSGHIIVNQNGSLMGQMAAVRMTSQKRAEMLRAKFKLIKVR